MAKRKATKSKPADRNHGARGAPPAVRLRKVAGGETWELVHPRCAEERADDMAEVQQMLAAGEIDIARDELRWLLEECADFIEAHKLLGELALTKDDFSLARGHFGNAFRLGQGAIAHGTAPQGTAPQTPTRFVPYSRPANQAFFEAGKGLAWCLQQLDKPDLAAEVIEQLLACDPSDPLNLREMLGA